MQQYFFLTGKKGKGAANEGPSGWEAAQSLRPPDFRPGGASGQGCQLFQRLEPGTVAAGGTADAGR